MKQIISILTLLLLVIQSKSTILRVNNTPGLVSVYTTVHQAIAVSNPGDTIHIEPSGIDYTEPFSISISHRLTILGNGSNLSIHPGLQADTNRAKITFNIGNRLVFLNGSEGSYLSCDVNSVGVAIDSMSIDKSYISDELIIADLGTFSNHISIRRSFIGQLNKVNSSTPIWIKHCIVNLYAVIGAPINSYQFENCIIRLVNSSNDFSNCLFVKSILTSSFSNTVVGFSNCTLNDNIFTSVINPTGLNNTDSVNNQFINQAIIFNTFPVSGITDNNFKYKSAFNPIDKGPYVGIKPYTFGLVPAIPSIYELTVPATFVNGGPGNTLQITISTRGNQ